LPDEALSVVGYHMANVLVKAEELRAAVAQLVRLVGR
jgi:hypothetical protein